MACSWNNYCPLCVNEENLQQLNCILFLVVKTEIWYIIRILKVFQGLLLPFFIRFVPCEAYEKFSKWYVHLRNIKHRLS